MSESLVGRAVASTRQKAGSVIAADAPGGVKLPAAIAVADRIVTLGMVSAARFAHAVPAAAGVRTWPSSGTAATTALAKTRRLMTTSLAARLYASPPDRGHGGLANSVSRRSFG